MPTRYRWRRVPCAGGCDRLVPREAGECRKCRKKRLRAGYRQLRAAGQPPPERSPTFASPGYLQFLLDKIRRKES